MDDRWISVDEIAAYLGVSKDTVRAGENGWPSSAQLGLRARPVRASEPPIAKLVAVARSRRRLIVINRSEILFIRRHPRWYWQGLFQGVCVCKPGTIGTGS